MNLHPTLMYYGTGRESREIVHFRFEDYGSAREVYRRLREILSSKDLPHKVINAGPEIYSGEYQFELIFDRGITRTEIDSAMHKTPLL